MSTDFTKEDVVAWYFTHEDKEGNSNSSLVSSTIKLAAWPSERQIDNHLQLLKNAVEKSCDNSEKKSLKRLADGSLPPFDGSTAQLSNSLTDGISFGEALILAEELALSFSHGIKCGRAMNVSGHDSKEEEEACIVGKVDNLDDSIRRKNPFASAKERFEQEGGKFSISASSKKSNNKPKVANQEFGNSKVTDEELPPELANCDKGLIDRIEADIIHHGQQVTFSDIAGLEFAKECVVETICWPMTQPKLFQGLRSLPRGVLLFGPPGTGKTLIGKAIAHQSGATFFSISASSLMSKWIGEGEKTVRALFAVAAFRQPSVVFIDEVDSLLCQRSADENEASRRMKTEFMVQLDGANTNIDARVVIIGATNRPEELDEAVRRRFVKRLYIPLPDEVSRRALIKSLVKEVHHTLSLDDIEVLTKNTDGYSGADIRNLCTEAAMGPIRQLAQSSKGILSAITADDIPPVIFSHFQTALETVTPSVSQADLRRYLDWNSMYGSFKRQR